MYCPAVSNKLFINHLAFPAMIFVKTMQLILCKTHLQSLKLFKNYASVQLTMVAINNSVEAD